MSNNNRARTRQTIGCRRINIIIFDEIELKLLCESFHILFPIEEFIYIDSIRDSDIAGQRTHVKLFCERMIRFWCRCVGMEKNMIQESSVVTNYRTTLMLSRYARKVFVHRNSYATTLTVFCIHIEIAIKKILFTIKWHASCNHTFQYAKQNIEFINS